MEELKAIAAWLVEMFNMPMKDFEPLHWMVLVMLLAVAIVILSWVDDLLRWLIRTL